MVQLGFERRPLRLPARGSLWSVRAYPLDGTANRKEVFSSVHELV